jgi:hypothetical protein
LLTGLLVIAWVALAGSEPRTVLLVEHPERFLLCNRYQQRLTSDEYRALPPVLPLAVVQEFGMLNDGLTPCAATEFNGSPMFIIRDRGGAFVRRGEGGAITAFRNAVVLGDTVELLQREELRGRSPASEIVKLLPARTRIVRHFRADARTYVQTLVPGAASRGWLTLPESAHQSIWTHSAASTVMPPSVSNVTQRLTPLLGDANRALAAIYDQLATESGVHRSPPSFRLFTSADQCVCSIEPQSMGETFAGSVRALLPECERALLGTGLRPRLSGGSIVIPLR